MSIVEKAREFAITAHGEQKRKYNGEPYWKHLEEVADLVSLFCTSEWWYHYARAYRHDGYFRDSLIAAAWLHDTVEDTFVTFDDLGHHFGAEITGLVSWLTDVSQPHDGNRTTRKEIDRRHIAKAPPAAKTVKLADLISNARNISALDPDFARVYMREKASLLLVLSEGHPDLYKTALRIVLEYKYGQLPV